jgi:hypothetical protein
MVVEAGRSRWKIENENNNVLKTKGYHLEHNFGHGQQHLSNVLVTLNLLAFLTHTIQEITNGVYQALRKKLGARKTFFQDLRALTRYLIFDSWMIYFYSWQTAWKSPFLLHNRVLDSELLVRIRLAG